MRTATAALLFIGLLLGIGAPALATPKSVMVRLHPVGRSHVTGTVTFIAAGNYTKTMVDVRHLPHGARPFAVMHAGACSNLARLSASSMFLPALRMRGGGRATGSGWLHGPDAGGTWKVHLWEVTGGGSVVVVGLEVPRGSKRVPPLVACGETG